MAAGIQAGIGNVAAGSLFAIAQSIGAGGAVPAVFTAIGGGISAVAAAIGVGMVGDDDDPIAAWVRAEILATAARIESAAVAAWARAEVHAAAARIESAAVAAWARAEVLAAAARICL